MSQTTELGQIWIPKWIGLKLTHFYINTILATHARPDLDSNQAPILSKFSPCMWK